MKQTIIKIETPKTDLGEAYITVAAMLSSRNRPRAFAVDFRTYIIREVLADIGALYQRAIGDGWNCIGVSFNKSTFTFVPSRQ